MLGIKINNEFLDHTADISLELERNNPYLSNDEIPGEYSLGISLRYSDKNYRLLNYNGNWTKKKNKISVDAQVDEKG